MLRILSCESRDDSRTTVDKHWLDRDPLTGRLLEQSENERGYLGSAVDGLPHGSCLSAPVAVEDGVFREQLHQPLEVAMASGGEKGPQQGLTVFSRRLVAGLI